MAPCDHTFVSKAFGTQENISLYRFPPSCGSATWTLTQNSSWPSGASRVWPPPVPPSQPPLSFLPSPGLATHSCWSSLLSLARQPSVIGNLSSLIPFCPRRPSGVAAPFPCHAPSTISVWACPAFPLGVPRCLSLHRSPPVLPPRARR